MFLIPAVRAWLFLSLALGTSAFAQDRSASAPEAESGVQVGAAERLGVAPASVQVFQSDVFVPRTFNEILGFREYSAAPGDESTPGFLIQAEFYRSGSATRRTFWANCAADGPKALPVVTSEAGTRILFPWVSCAFAPVNHQVGKDAQAGDMTNSNRPFTVFYDRVAQNGLRHDVKLYVLGYKRGTTYPLGSRARVFLNLTVNLIGARLVQFLEEGEKGASESASGSTASAAANQVRTAGAFQPFALNPEVGASWDLSKKSTLTVTALGMQGHWSVAPTQAGRFGPGASDLQYYVKARLDAGKFSVATEYDFYRFSGTGLPAYNSFVIGTKIFSTDWIHRKGR